MKKRLLILLIVSVLSGAEEKNFLDVDEIKKGDRGYGLTTFIGSSIDTFYVEIIDILKGQGTGQDIILARLYGRDLEETGVISGMSGSPVYVNGKIIGAVAYAWPFGKEPICGITTFKDMLNRDEKGVIENVIPIKGILTLSGISRNEFIDTIVHKLSLEVLPGGISDKEIEIKPGAPCGMVLAYGDAVLSVFGTLTYVKDGYIYAFGHPAFSGGNVRIPFSMGEVNAVFPSIYSSFKIVSPSKIIGSVVYDGKGGIIAKIGDKADVVEFVMRYGDEKRVYYITKEDFLLKNIFASFLYNNLLEFTGNSFEGSITGNFKFLTTSNDTFSYDIISSESPVRSLTMEAYYYLNFLSQNNIKKIEIKKIDVDIEKKPFKEFIIKDVVLNKEEYKPSEDIYIKIILERLRDNDTTIYLRLKSPKVEGEYIINVSSEREAYFEKERIIKNEKELIMYLKNIPEYKEISVNINRMGEKFKQGEQIVNTTKKIIFKDGIESGYGIIEKKIMKMEGNVSGKKEIKINVRR